AINLPRVTEPNAPWEEKADFTCRSDEKPVRTFETTTRQGRPIPLVFTFTNAGKTVATFSSVVADVSVAVRLAPKGTAGPIESKETYPILLKHKTGTQKFPLNPAFEIPADSTGAFTLEFIPDDYGPGLCWIMEVVFDAGVGRVRSPEFSLIMRNIRPRHGQAPDK